MSDAKHKAIRIRELYKLSGLLEEAHYIMSGLCREDEEAMWKRLKELFGHLVAANFCSALDEASRIAEILMMDLEGELGNE